MSIRSRIRSLLRIRTVDTHTSFSDSDESTRNTVAQLLAHAAVQQYRTDTGRHTLLVESIQSFMNYELFDSDHFTNEHQARFIAIMRETLENARLTVDDIHLTVEETHRELPARRLVITTVVELRTYRQ